MERLYAWLPFKYRNRGANGRWAALTKENNGVLLFINNKKRIRDKKFQSKKKKVSKNI